jgi:hypothetical protein
VCQQLVLVKKRRRLQTIPIHSVPNYRVACACGCGKSVYAFNQNNRLRRFRRGHNVVVAPTYYWRPVLSALRAIGRARPSDLAPGLGKTSNAVNLILYRALKDGLVYNPKYGHYELTIEGLKQLALVEAGHMKRPRS